MEGKRYIATVQALQTIEGVVEKGAIYKLKEMKSLFPYIDFNNPDYFKMIYTGDRFKKGNRVRYTGKPDIPKDGLKNNKVYVVKDVAHMTKGDFLYTSYYITLPDSTEQHFVKEVELEPAESKWIVSFSNDSRQEQPAVHELDYFAWRDSIKNTWKNIFVFDTKEDALSVAQMFAKHDICEIYNKVKSPFGRDIYKKDF